MAMAVAIDTARLATFFIHMMQRRLDRAAGGRRRFQVHRVSAYATIPFPDSEIWRHSHLALEGGGNFHDSMPKRGALEWQPDPDDDLGDVEVLHHLHQQAATVPLLSSVISQSDHGNAATTLTGSALSASINTRTQGRHLSSFHRYSFRLSDLGRWKGTSSNGGIGRETNGTAIFPFDREDLGFFDCCISELYDIIVWAGLPAVDHIVFSQLQVDFVDLFNRRTLPTSRPGRRRRTAFNPFLQLSDSPAVEDTSRRNPLPHARRFKGVRYRPDRRTWVAEMKPPKHKTKKDFGNFKSEAEAAHAVDAAFHHYGRPDLLNFPRISLPFLSTRPTAPPGLDEKAKVKFVKEEAKLLLAAVAATSPLHSLPMQSLPFSIQELSMSPRRCPSGQFRSHSEISAPFSCSGPEEVDDVVSQPQPGLLLHSNYDISTTGVQTNLVILNSEQSVEQGWDWAEDSSTLAMPPNVTNPSAYKIQSMWLDSLIQSPPKCAMYSRSPSPSRFQEEIANALLEQQSFSA